MRMILLVVLGLSVVGAPTWSASSDDAADSPSVVSSWRGGALTLERFIAEYDPTMRNLNSGGDQLREAICKATFREIYAPRAKRTGLDRNPAYLAELEKWRRERLSALYVEKNRPDLADGLTQERLLAYYEETKAARYTSSGSVDLEVLFLRCSEDPEERRACTARMADFNRRLDKGEDFPAVILEERGRSGNANGVYPRLAMKTLSPDLAEIARMLPLGEFSPVIETPTGLFLLRVSRRDPPSAMPYSQVALHVRQEAEKAALARWREAEIERLGESSMEGIPDHSDPTDLLVTAALAQSLDDDPDFVSAERHWSTWELANRGLFADSAVMPPDEDIKKQLESDPVVSRKFRLYSVVLVVVKARENRYEMLETVNAITNVVTLVEDAAAALANLAGSEAGVEIFEITDVTRSDLARLDRHLTDCVTDLEPGGWCGPQAVATPRSFPGDVAERTGLESLPSGAAFLALVGWRTPRVGEVRSEYYRHFRRSIAACDRFLELVGKRWDLRIDMPSSGSSVMTFP